MSTGIKYSTDDEVLADLGREPKPTAYNTEPGFPFDRMADRSFECLLHDIAASPQRARDEKFGKYDRAVLMQGVGERGRDCALIRAGNHVGAIQCKRHQALITKPDAVREIIKYCLHAIKDPALMPDPREFTYVFATSRDFNEKAKVLLNGFGSLIGQEAELAAWTTEVIAEYQAFAGLTADGVMPPLKRLLENISVVPICFNDLESLLTGETKVIQKYFTVRTVVDDEQVKAIGDKIDAVHRSLGDEDTRRLLDVFNAQRKDRRADFGIFSLWGYPERLLKETLASGRLMEIGMALAKAKADLDNLFAIQLSSWIGDEIFEKVTTLKRFSTLVISAATPYLSSRLLDRWRKNQQGNTLTSVLPRPAVRMDSLAIRKHLLELGADYLRNDWSRYSGDAELLALKKQVAAQTYRPYPDVAAMERTFDFEWPSLLPILEEIEARLEAEIPSDSIVVLRTLRWWDDERHLKSILEAIAKRNKP